jgi:hypothetical protein
MQPALATGSTHPSPNAKVRQLHRPHEINVVRRRFNGPLHSKTMEG